MKNLFDSTGQVLTQYNDIANYASGKLLGTVSITNTKWTGAQITTDATANTITIVAHGLSNGDRVAFVPLTGDYSVLPSALRAGYSYYVVNVSGDSFQVSTSNGGGAVDFTTAGTPASYQIEKITIGNIDITGLTSQKCKVVMSGGISGKDFSQLAARFNGISTAVYNPNQTESLGSTSFLLFYSSSATATHVFSVLDCFVNNNRLYMSCEPTFALGSNNATPTQIDRIAQRITSGNTLPNANFSNITSISVGLNTASSYFLDGFKVEVWSS